jgi:hypothetical protein
MLNRALEALIKISFCRGALIAVAALALVPAIRAQNPTERALSVVEVPLYIAPDSNSQKLATVERGREMAIIETSREWVHVFANVEGGPLAVDEDVPQGRNVTGWVRDKGIVRTNTPNGDRIIFGEAADSEAEASRRRGRRGAAQDAMRLYARMAEYFPNSPLAGEAAWRAADIRWQIEREDVFSRPSARESDPGMRDKINENYLKRVEKKFPHTKWADLAAFDLIDNKLCGDWRGSSKCPEKEADIYTKYADERPQSPKAAEALYQAAWRRSALIEIYKSEGQPGKSEQARKEAIATAQRITSQYVDSDWAARAANLIFKMNQSIPTYGIAGE